MSAGGNSQDDVSHHTETAPDPSMRRLVGITLLSWLVIVGLDFLQNAGVFARFWLEPGSAVLPPEKLFKRIPLGYLVFLISASMLTWLMSRLKVLGWKEGALFGLKLGGLLSISWVLGLVCVFPIRHSILLVWFFGGLIQYISAAAVIGIGLSSNRLGLLSATVAGLFIVLVIATIVMQTLGFAPAMQFGNTKLHDRPFRIGT